MQDNQPQNTAPQAPIKIYAAGALALISLVGGVIYVNSQTVLGVPLPDNIPVMVTPVPPIIEPVILETPTVVNEAPIIEPQLVTPPVPVAEVPVIEIPKPKPLPTLDDSDELFMAKASQLSWLPTFAKQLIKKDLARNFVTFVDNFSRGDLAAKYSPIEKPQQKFSINEVEDDMYIDPISYKRYDAYVDMLNSINLDMAIDNLKELTPLLDKAYMELGYDKGVFMSTLEQAVNEMLLAPVIRNPIKLVAPSAMYKYDDPQLESLSDVQKLMLRMGPDNITKLRPKLQQIQVSLSELNN